jgi:hypothetical protein
LGFIKNQWQYFKKKAQNVVREFEFDPTNSQTKVIGLFYDSELP